MHHQVRARMHGRQRPDLERIEHAEHVELSFLRKVGGVGEHGEGDLHSRNIDCLES
jgi:hypothetical protein